MQGGIVALHITSVKNTIEATKALIENGAEVDIQDDVSSIIK